MEKNSCFFYNCKECVKKKIALSAIIEKTCKNEGAETCGDAKETLQSYYR